MIERESVRYDNIEIYVKYQECVSFDLFFFFLFFFSLKEKIGRRNRKRNIRSLRSVVLTLDLIGRREWNTGVLIIL